MIEERIITPRDERAIEGRVIEGGRGSAAVPRTLGGVGGHIGAPHAISERVIEARHDSFGARRALGGVGGHLGAPHVH